MKTNPQFGLTPLTQFRRTAFAAICLTLLASGAMPAKPGNGKGNGGGNGEGNGNAKGPASDFVPPGHRRAAVEVIVKQAPPAPRVEVVPARPSPQHIWVPGFWVWESDAYIWTPGVWMLPPEPSAVWVEPRFEVRSGVNIFISGYWKL